MFRIFEKMGHIFLYSRIDEDVITCRPLYWNFRTYSALLPKDAIDDFKNTFKSRRTRAETNFFGLSTALNSNFAKLKISDNVPKTTSPNRKKQQALIQEYWAEYETIESSSSGGSSLGDLSTLTNVPNGASIPNGDTVFDASPNGASELGGDPNGGSTPNGATVLDAARDGGSNPNGASELSGDPNGGSTPNGATELGVLPNGASVPNGATELGGDPNEGSTRSGMSEIGGGPNGVESAESSSL